MKKSTGLILLFIAIFMAAVFSSRAEADVGSATVSIGRSVVNSNVSYGEIGYRWRTFEINAGHFGQGETKYGDTREVTTYYSLTHKVNPNWCYKSFCNFYKIGVAYVEDSILVGPTNYRLGVGVSYKMFDIEWMHLSSGGIHDRNSGIDAVKLTVDIPLKLR